MRCLLDTHAFLWFIANDPRLPARVGTIIEAPENEICLSMVSLWEIGVKSSIGKLPLADNVLGLQATALSQSIALLPITAEAIHKTTILPWHHKDLFDRIIIATAQTEGLTVLSVDTEFSLYDVSRIW